MAEEKRISCVGFLSLKVTRKHKLEEKILAYRNEHDIYTLFGGWYKFFDEARKDLDLLGAEYESGNDLRLYIPQENLPHFKIWHAHEINREVAPLSALEDAFKRQGIAIDPTALNLTWTRSLCKMGESRVPDSRIKLTHFFVDYFTPHLTDDQRKTLYEAMAKSKDIVLLGKDDLQKGTYKRRWTDKKRRIDPLVKYAL